MGCDIHLHVEVKINGEWHHYAHPYVERDYSLFGRMAGVRDEAQEPVAPLRGVPSDATFLTRYDYKLWGEDSHSASWLGPKEVHALANWWKKRNPSAMSFEWDAISQTYLLRSSFTGFVDYPDENARKHPGLEDFRFVFWFDN
jgi:hypothetical protein